MLPEKRSPAANCLPISRTPNQLLNSSTWVSARHTRARVAFNTILRSIRSVDVFICNLLVAYYDRAVSEGIPGGDISMPGVQPFSCAFRFRLGLRLCRCFGLGGWCCRIGP